MTKLFRHFLNLDEIDTNEINLILKESHKVKKNYKKKQFTEKKILAMIFEKPSTRTRVSFEVGMKLLNGDVVILDHADSQLGRGESLEDTMKVLSKYVDIVVYRGSNEERLYKLSKISTVPIINGLTDASHPCQIIADIMTLQEKFKSLNDLNISWIGDGNNVCNSWIHASIHFDFNLKISCPSGNFPQKKILEKFKKGNIQLYNDPYEAVINSDVIITDTWVSMGMKSDPGRLKKFKKFQINEKLLKKTNKQTYFLHCLPAHRGCEVTDEVIDGEKSLVWIEAENRLYAHQAILLWCLKKI
jgi:ornithine carbamoyltransferase